MSTLIIGAGYTGLRLAELLRISGQQVTCWVRSEESALAVRAAGCGVIVGDVADGWIWDGLNDLWDVVIFCASSSRGGMEAYRHVYGRGLREVLARCSGAQRLIYTSSTSVYAQNDESLVDETTPAVAQGETAEILVTAEDRVLSAYGTVLRLSGIYGPGRTVYLKKYVEEATALPGDGSRWVNMIHRDDAASALAWVMQKPETIGQIYNVTDSCPVRLKELVGWLAGRVGKAAPSCGASDEEPRKRGITSKRISNAKLRNLGWLPEYPSYREGYGALIPSA
jgi:nucleoside-diphosphate-sugar epimerase